MSPKEQIKTAAIKIMAREGFADTTVDKIVQEAQVPLNTFYNIFATVEEVLDDILASEFQKRSDFYVNMKNWRMDWFLKINGILNFHLQEIQKEPELTSVIFSEKRNPHCRQKESLRKFSQLSSIIADILQQAIDEQKIRLCDVQATSLVFFGFLDALVYEFILTQNLAQLKQAIDNFGLLLKNGLEISSAKTN